MDLLSVFRTFRRHWLAALPVLLVTLACLGYVVVVRAPDFETSTNVVLISPPAAPLDGDGQPIRQTPAGKTDNPLARFGDQSVVVNIVSRAVSSDVNRVKLKEEGADPRYEITPATSGPIAEIQAVGTTAEQAELSASLVATSFVDNLAAVQAAQGVDPAYFITTLPVEPPSDAQPKLTSTVRLAVGVLGLGLLATFFTVSLAEARSSAKRQREDPEDGSEDDTSQADGPPGEDDTALTPAPKLPPGPTWRAS